MPLESHGVRQSQVLVTAGFVSPAFGAPRSGGLALGSAEQESFQLYLQGKYEVVMVNKMSRLGSSPRDIAFKHKTSSPKLRLSPSTNKEPCRSPVCNTGLTFPAKTNARKKAQKMWEKVEQIVRTDVIGPSADC